MLNGPLALNIIRFAIPFAIASILQQLFNSTDAAVAGQFVSSGALAAISGTTPVVTSRLVFSAPCERCLAQL